MHNKLYLQISLLYILLIISCASSSNLPSWSNKLPIQDGYIYDRGYAKLSSIETSKSASRLNAVSNLSNKIYGKFVVQDDSIKEVITINSKDIETVDVRVLKDGGVWTLVRIKDVN